MKKAHIPKEVFKTPSQTQHVKYLENCSTTQSPPHLSVNLNHFIKTSVG